MSNIHALFTLKEAHLLRENRCFWAIIRPQFWFQKFGIVNSLKILTTTGNKSSDFQNRLFGTSSTCCLSYGEAGYKLSRSDKN